MGQKVNPNIIRLGKTKEWNLKHNENKPSEQSLYTFKNVEIKSFITKFLKDNGLILSDCRINFSNSTLNVFIAYYSTLELNLLTNKISTKNKNKAKKCYKISRHVNSLFNYKKKLNKKKLCKTKKIKFLKYSNNFFNKKIINIKSFHKSSFLEKFSESLKNFIKNKELKIIIIFKQLNKSVKNNFTKKKLGFIQEKITELRLFEKSSFFNEGLNTIWAINKSIDSSKLLSKFISSQLKILKKNHNFFLRFLKVALTIPINNTKFNSDIHGIKIKIKGKFNNSARAKHKIIIVGYIPLLTLKSITNYSEAVSYNSNGTFGVKVWVYKKH